MKWNWPTADEGRIKRAKAVKFSELDIADECPHGKAKGSGKEDYDVTLDSCTCPDFSISGNKGSAMPCKHMIALAMKCGLLSENGLTPPQQREADIKFLRAHLAAAYGFYYLFDDPMVSDSEYDKMKAQLSKLTQSE